jgi:hypothetical protein
MMGFLFGTSRETARRDACGTAPFLAVALLFGGCGANLNGLVTSSTTVANYQPASVFAPTGYSLSNNADGSLHITAAGPPGTPADRLERIALARAAEYGDEQHLKSFKATPPQTSITCGKTKVYIKGEATNIKPMDYRVVAVDVTYGTDALDPQARKSRETAETLKAQLASEAVPPDVQTAAAQEVAQQCGRQQ